jgi:hypothetical protein
MVELLEHNVGSSSSPKKVFFGFDCNSDGFVVCDSRSVVCGDHILAEVGLGEKTILSYLLLLIMDH